MTIMMWRFIACLLFVFGCFRNSVVSASTTTKEQKSSPTYSTFTARRERNLDYWDADTLAHYLGIDAHTGEIIKDAEYTGIDAAIMFYASWCRNCQAFASSWDAIAQHVKAGTVQSNLLMVLFDCERNHTHMKLCTAAGVKHYPTMLYVGSGPYFDTDPITRIVGKDRSAGPAGAARLPRTVKFQGNWQYPNSVLDWVKLMRGLSKWHYRTTHGFLRFLREGLLGFFFKRKRSKATPQNLPVGIPPQQTSTFSSSSSSSSSIPQPPPQDTVRLERQLEASKKETKQMSKLATHASVLINSVLFPASSNNATERGYVDVFAELRDKWDDKNTQEAQILKSCVTELSVDYCTRLTTRVAVDYVEATPASEIPSNMTLIEELLKQQIREQEPYCVLMEACVETDFAGPECRPETCPFVQDVACRYLSACMDETIQSEYAYVLGYVKEGETFKPKKETTTESAAENAFQPPKMNVETTTTGESSTTAAPPSQGGAAGEGEAFKPKTTSTETTTESTTAAPAGSSATAATGGGGGGWGLRKEDIEQIKPQMA